MIITTVMRTGLNFIVLSLTPLQRWQAIRRLNTGFMGERWFITACVAALIVLMALFVLVTFCRARKERKTANRLFFYYADERGLSPRERHILMYIATQAKLKSKEAIFTMADAFDRGATKIIRAAFALKGNVNRAHLNAELSVLREKLGFQKRGTASADKFIIKRPGSRQIPEDSKIYISSLEMNNFSNIESVVIENSQIELVIKPSKQLEIRKGEPLCVRYYFGAAIWEFDASVIECNGNTLVLNHTDNVRFVNRRRFYRVPINEPAYIAAFPFAKTLPVNAGGRAKANTAYSSGYNWGPPEFVPADVTELAGPGLRITAPLEVKVGDRVVVIMKLGEKRRYDLIKQANSTLHAEFAEQGNGNPSRIVEDIGVVRHSEAVRDGFSIAVELTGLDEMNLSEMVQATNAASLKARFEAQVVSDEIKGGTKKREQVFEPAVV